MEKDVWLIEDDNSCVTEAPQMDEDLQIDLNSIACPADFTVCMVPILPIEQVKLIPADSLAFSLCDR